MSDKTVTETSVEFDAKQLQATAVLYRQNKKMVDAASGYDSIDDAIAGLRAAWEVLEVQEDKGGRFTPAVELGFGSHNAAQIAESIMGLSQTVGATRKSFATLGK